MLVKGPLKEFSSRKGEIFAFTFIEEITCGGHHCNSLASTLHYDNIAMWKYFMGREVKEALLRERPIRFSTVNPKNILESFRNSCMSRKVFFFF